MTRNHKLLWLQVILGTAFLLQPLLLPVRPDELERFMLSKELLKNMVANVLILSFFYFNYHFLIPKYYFNKKYKSYLAAVLGCFILILWVSYVFTSHLPSVRPGFPMRPDDSFSFSHIAPPPPPFAPEHFSNQSQSLVKQFQLFFTEHDQVFFLFGAIVLFSLLLRVNKRYYQATNARQEAEINYLLAQINPHFLFNALNSIYTLTVKEKATNAADSLLKLSGLLRYVFTETHSNSVALEKDVACISDFIELQKLRLTRQVQLQYEVKGILSGKLVAPMLLMPFVENAFKHGISTDEPSEIHIHIEVTETSLTLWVSNTKVKQYNNLIEKSGLGIANVKSRLQLCYPKKHRLVIADNTNDYQTTLQLYF